MSESVTYGSRYCHCNVMVVEYFQQKVSRPAAYPIRRGYVPFCPKTGYGVEVEFSMKGMLGVPSINHQLQTLTHFPNKLQLNNCSFV